MNKDLIKSWIFKILPIVLAFIVGKGWIQQSDADQVVPVLNSLISSIDELLLAATSAITLWRSIRTHKQKSDGISG
jgi:hypothetical protein